MIKNYDMTIIYHPCNVNMVVDDLSQKAIRMGSLATLQRDECPFTRDV